MQWIALESHELGVFVGVKGAWFGEGKVERRHEVIRVWSIFIVSCLPFMQASDLLHGYDVIPHGVGAWQVIPYINF